MEIFKKIMFMLFVVAIVAVTAGCVYIMIAHPLVAAYGTKGEKNIVLITCGITLAVSMGYLFFIYNGD